MVTPLTFFSLFFFNFILYNFVSFHLINQRFANLKTNQVLILENKNYEFRHWQFGTPS